MGFKSTFWLLLDAAFVFVASYESRAFQRSFGFYDVLCWKLHPSEAVMISYDFDHSDIQPLFTIHTHLHIFKLLYYNQV